MNEVSTLRIGERGIKSGQDLWNSPMLSMNTLIHYFVKNVQGLVVENLQLT